MVIIMIIQRVIINIKSENSYLTFIKYRPLLLHEKGVFIYDSFRRVKLRCLSKM